MSSKTVENQPPKRARKAITKLHQLVDYLEYYCGGKSDFFRNIIINDLASYIEETLYDLSIEKNIDHIRLTTKIKAIWKKQEEDRIEERVEERLEEEVEQRLGDMLEEINKESTDDE